MSYNIVDVSEVCNLSNMVNSHLCNTPLSYGLDMAKNNYIIVLMNTNTNYVQQVCAGTLKECYCFLQGVYSLLLCMKG